MPDPAGFQVSEATAADPDLLRSLLPLLPQLSSSPPLLSLEELEQIVTSPATRLLVATDAEGRVHGMLTLVLFLVPTGMRAWIEDVVVDEGIRRGGVGAALRAVRGGGRGGRGGPYGRSHLPTEQGGRQPALPASGFRAPGNERLPPPVGSQMRPPDGVGADG